VTIISSRYIILVQSSRERGNLKTTRKNLKALLVKNGKRFFMSIDRKI